MVSTGDFQKVVFFDVRSVISRLRGSGPDLVESGVREGGPGGVRKRLYRTLFNSGTVS